METLCACAVEAGAGREVLRAILASATTDAALMALSESGLLPRTMDVLGRRINDTLCRHVPENVEIGFVCFTNTPALKGILTKSGNADELMELWKK